MQKRGKLFYTHLKVVHGKRKRLRFSPDPTKDLVDMVLNNRRSLSLDYALLAFSGHGVLYKANKLFD